MSPVLVLVIEVGVGILTVAMLVQLTLWMAMLRMALRVRARVQRSVPGIQALKSVSMAVTNENRAPVMKIAASLKELAGVTRHEAVLLKDVGDEALRFYRTERQHAGVVVEDAKHRAQETTHLVRRGIEAPFRGVAHGVKNAIRHLTRNAA